MKPTFKPFHDGAIIHFLIFAISHPSLYYEIVFVKSLRIYSISIDKLYYHDSFYSKPIYMTYSSKLSILQMTTFSPSSFKFEFLSFKPLKSECKESNLN